MTERHKASSPAEKKRITEANAEDDEKALAAKLKPVNDKLNKITNK